MFLLFIFIIPLLNLLSPTKQFSISENRTLQQLPKFSLKHLLDGSFTKDFENYISDQFFMRDNWVHAKSSIEKAIGKNDNNDVYLGKNGYLLQMFDGKDEELTKKIDAINSFATSNKDITMNIMLVPNSVKVLAKNLPTYASPDDELIYLSNIRKNLNSNINFIDTYKALSSNNNDYIYYKTDHHWTTKGAYYAYKEAAKTLGFTPHDPAYFSIKEVTQNFYGTLYSKSGYRNIDPDNMYIYTPKVSENYTVKYYDNNKTSNSLYNFEALKTKDKYAAFLDGNHSLIHITTNNNSGKSIVIVKDSYANSFIPFLTGNYSNIYVIDLRYYNDNLSQFMKTNKLNELLILYNVISFKEDLEIEGIAD